MGVNHCLLNFVNSLCRKLLQVVFFMLSFFTLVSLIAFYGWGLHPLFCQAPFNIYYFFFLLKNAPFALLMQKVVILRTGVVFANRMTCQLIIFMSSVWGWCIIFGLKCSFCLQCYCCVSFNKKIQHCLGAVVLWETKEESQDNCSTMHFCAQPEERDQRVFCIKV